MCVFVYKWQTFYLYSASVSAIYSRSLVSESIICLLEGPSCVWVWSQHRPDRGLLMCFLSLTGNCRSELRPPDEHCGTLPSAASRYDPPRTRNRSISERIQNIMRGWDINSASLQSADIRLQSACPCQTSEALTEAEDTEAQDAPERLSL